MSNILTFLSAHKSITSLPEVTLPKFVVLTGKNGSGKTHLLAAIKDGKVRSSLVNSIETDVRVFDSATIVPTDTGIFDPFQDQTRRSQWFNNISNQRESNFPQIKNSVMQLGVPSQYCSNINSIYKLSVEALQEILPDSAKAAETEVRIKSLIKQFGNSIGSTSINQINDPHWRKSAPKVLQSSPEKFVVATHSDFFEDPAFLWGDVDPFQQAFGRIFSNYRELIHSNDRLEKYPPKHDPTKIYLPPEKFIAEFGVPPWDFVNQILAECRLDFRVDHPPLHETTSYEPKLHKLSSFVEMRFQDLSSGEKVLMSFALCLYNAREVRQQKIFPKLLLLDEVDAPLHPSMAVSLLNTIQNVLVKSKDVAVILTTHSPSTVALAPEESIYAMNPEGPSVDKISKSSAVSLLTTGVPTLSVSFDGRRQVFVESRTDANIYELLYQRYKTKLDSERSLVFVEVGNKDDSGGEKNSGCAQVKRLVENLLRGGNRSVLGLIDWDGCREPSDRVHILSPKIRNGLESLLFDPVLLASLIAREHREFAHQKGILDAAESYAQMLNWDADRWHCAVDIIQTLVLGKANISDRKIKIKYVSGMMLDISETFLHLDDHQLEAIIIKEFGFLKPKNNHAGGLMRHMLNTVLADFPGFLPSDLLATFSTLLAAEALDDNQSSVQNGKVIAATVDEGVK